MPLPPHLALPLSASPVLRPSEPLRTTSCQSLLALDLGAHTGWALRQRDGTVTSGTRHFKPSRFEGGGMRYLLPKTGEQVPPTRAGCAR